MRRPTRSLLALIALGSIALAACSDDGGTAPSRSGTAQGEVGRLWMFWVPVVVLLAAKELKPWVARDRRVLLGVLAVQVIMVFLTHYFQDLKM